MVTKLPFDPEEDIKNFGPPKDERPRPAAPPKRTASKSVVTAVPLAQIKDSLTDMYVLVGSILSSYPNPKMQMVGSAITLNHEKCVESIIDAAKKDPKLARALSKLVTTSVYGAIVVAHLPILMSIYFAFTVKLPGGEDEQGGGTPESA